MRQRWLAVLCYLVLVGAFAASVWASYRAAFPERGLYRVVGSFQARDGDRRILIRHESVPGLMDEMDLMSLDVESTAVLEGTALRAGDRVRVTVRQLPGRLVVTDVQKLPRFRRRPRRPGAGPERPRSRSGKVREVGNQLADLLVAQVEPERRHARLPERAAPVLDHLEQVVVGERPERGRVG